MNTTTEKRLYCPPQLKCVELDNEISLVLVSGDPGDPGALLIAPEYFNNNPFKTLNG